MKPPPAGAEGGFTRALSFELAVASKQAGRGVERALAEEFVEACRLLWRKPMSVSRLGRGPTWQSKRLILPCCAVI